MRSVLLLKFDKCERYPLWQSLLGPADSVLLEASGTDTFWGVGQYGEEAQKVAAVDNGVSVC
jgi:predicted NAD-dependent protein-ADP-ribosyltransferase YbiA (DUF1768 family)